MSLIDTVSSAIASFEGYYNPGSVADRNNNPGNLRSWGNRPVRDGFALFDSPEEGWAALRRQVELNISRGLSLREFFGGKPGVYSGYAPAADSNDPNRYAEFVAARAGVPADIPLAAGSAGVPILSSPSSEDLGVLFVTAAAAVAALVLAS